MSDIASRINNLSAEKRALLLQRLQKKAEDQSSQQSIPRLSRTSRAFPLSFTQQRFWFLEQLVPGNSFYNIPLVFRLQGKLRVRILERSFSELVRRHETLRTHFISSEERPLQVIVPPAESFSLPVADLQAFAEEVQASAAQDLMHSEATRPFNLATGPLVRALLLRLQNEEHLLLLTLHHIIFDGLSTEIFWRELSSLYTAFVKELPSPLDEIPIQYVDYASWQRQWLQGDILEAQLSYWRQQLANAPATLELPTDRPRPPMQSFRASTCYFTLPAHLTRDLKELSRHEGVTLFMTLLATLQLLLYRYTAQRTIIVGTPIANRSRVETEGVIGPFINTLLLRTDFQVDLPFRELLRRVRETSLNAYAHQDLPFEQLVEAIQPERNMSQNPLFQVLFALQKPAEKLTLPDLTLQLLENFSNTTNCDLNLAIAEIADSLEGSLEYSVDLFDEATITRMIGHWQTLLEHIVANPEQRLSELPLLTPAERQQILITWNDTRVDEPEEQCVHHLFEAQAARAPDAIALVYEDTHLTYSALNRRANQLAHDLRKKGIGPDIPVGLCVDRSLEMVIGILGILKAGGAYVPLDPDLPRERLVFLFENAGASVILTQQHLLRYLPEEVYHIFCLDTHWEQLAGASPSNPARQVLPAHLMYIMYTSGSTGQPKGVAVTHAGICNRLHWMQQAYRLQEHDRVLQKTPFSFDVSVWEYFWPLLFGARLIIARPDGHWDSAYLLKLIDLQQVTTLHFVLSMLQNFLEETELQPNTSLQRVISSGEALTYETMERFFTRVNASLYNLYGPTEASIDVSAWICQPENRYRRVPIGRPINNIQLYVLDRHFEPVPIGIPGELYIGGVGLARGYWRRPELTAQYFLPHPFSDEPGARLYRTGDRARYLPDGNIEFLGRMDSQIKVRGIRVELGEIEAALMRHPNVLECAVSQREDRLGDKRLVAYFVVRQQSEPEEQTLRSFLQKTLPEYMMPSTFVPLETLPLTTSGKVDRRALPAPSMDRSEAKARFEPPQTPTQIALVDIWRRLLGLERVGIQDNFFEMGGHSLLATRVISHIRDILHVDFPLRTFFETPTIASIAETIETLRWVKNGTLLAADSITGDFEEGEI